MAFKNRLLATAAIPLVALIGFGPVSAAEIIRPSEPAETQPLVIKVQSTDDQEQLKKQQRREQRQQNQQNQNSEQNQSRKNRQDQNAGQEDQQDNNNRQRRNKQNSDAGTQQLNDSQQTEQPRRKKQQQSEDNTVQTPADNGDQQQVKPRHKKNNDNAETQQNTDQSQQGDEQQVKPRHKKNNDNAETQQNTDQSQQTDQQQVKPRHKKNSDNAETQQNADQGQQSDEQQVKPRRNKQQDQNADQQQNDNATSDQGKSTNDKLKDAVEKANRKNRKQNQDRADQPTDNSGSSIERIQTKKKDQQADQNDDNARPRKNAQPVDVKKAKDIAADPSKTTDTVVLPVDNGAAVLDSDKDADNRGADRDRRKQQREEGKNLPAPKSDKDAQRGFKDGGQVRIQPVFKDKGERIPGFKGYDDFGGRRIGDRDNRFVINIGGKLVIRSDDDTRLARNQKISYERLPNNMIREVIVQPNGDKIVTVRNRWGEIVRRSRVMGQREVVIFYSPALERGRDRLFLRDPGDELPPMRLTIPLRDYIIDVSGNGGGSRNYEEFLDEPPVEQVERVYSVDEVKNSARIRDKMRRIDLDTITFDTGSAEIAQDQVSSLQKVGDAIKEIIDKDPGETFLIEGHTDAVGSDESNLVLSDSRAEAVAGVLSDAFGIPPENLVTQGYGERYLKVNTDAPERLNRRVTIRRITPLVRPAEAAAE